MVTVKLRPWSGYACALRTITGSNNVKFIRRWRACGPNVSEIVFVDTLSKHSETAAEEVVARVLDCRSSN